MAKDESGRRFPYVPMPLGNILPAVTRPAFRRRSPAAAQVLADWAAIVGPALAAATTPLRLSGGTLTLACAGPVAMELQHLAPEVIGRINSHLGKVVVERLRFVQRAGLRPAAPTPAAPDKALPEHVQGRLADVPEGDLRQALENLARGVYRTR